MKFSICNDTYADRDCVAAAEHAASCGYNGLELAPSTIWKHPQNIQISEAKLLADKINHLNLDIVGFHWLLTGTEGMHLTNPDAAFQTRLIQHVAHLAKLCSAMGGKVMVWGSPKMRNLEPDWDAAAAEQRVVTTLRKLCQIIEPLNVTLALEPLATWETNYWTTADDTWRTIEQVDHPNCRLHLDCKAMDNEDDDPAAIIKRHEGHFVHFHANDPNLLGPGMGSMDLIPVAQALKEVQYREWVSVETFKLGPGPEQIAEQSLAFLKQHF